MLSQKSRQLAGSGGEIPVSSPKLYISSTTFSSALPSNEFAVRSLQARNVPNVRPLCAGIQGRTKQFVEQRWEIWIRMKRQKKCHTHAHTFLTEIGWIGTGLRLAQRWRRQSVTTQNDTIVDIPSRLLTNYVWLKMKYCHKMLAFLSLFGLILFNDCVSHDPSSQKTFVQNRYLQHVSSFLCDHDVDFSTMLAANTEKDSTTKRNINDTPPVLFAQTCNIWVESTWSWEFPGLSCFVRRLGQVQNKHHALARNARLSIIFRVGTQQLCWGLQKVSRCWEVLRCWLLHRYSLTTELTKVLPVEGCPSTNSWIHPGMFSCCQSCMSGFERFDVFHFETSCIARRGFFGVKKPHDVWRSNLVGWHNYFVELRERWL